MRNFEDPNDPTHPDHDLSEGAPPTDGAAPPKPWPLRRWMLMIVAVLVVVSLLLPFLRNIV